ncbi:hypothetical protein ACWF9B_00840 [Streptomyces sp. NPDC055089]
MAAAQTRRSSFRTAEYWAVVEAIADDLIGETASRTSHPFRDAAGALRKLSSRGFGPASLFDLCALLLLAAPPSPAKLSGTGDRDPAIPRPGTPMPASPNVVLRRGPVVVVAHPTKRHVQHLRELEAAVAEALLVSSEHPRARDAVRRALMAGGRSVQDATVVYGIVCELLVPSALSPARENSQPLTPSEQLQ